MRNLFSKIDLFVKLANLSPDQARAILGVSLTATDDEINKAYKRMARNFHPDINKSPDANAKLVELNTARDILLFPERSGPAADFIRQNEEKVKGVEDILDRHQQVADEWLADIQARKAVREEWYDYMDNKVTIDQLKHQENKDKAPEIEIKRQRYREKLERDKQRRQEAKKKKLGIV